MTTATPGVWVHACVRGCACATRTLTKSFLWSVSCRKQTGRRSPQRAELPALKLRPLGIGKAYTVISGHNAGATIAQATRAWTPQRFGCHCTTEAGAVVILLPSEKAHRCRKWEMHGYAVPRTLWGQSPHRNETCRNGSTKSERHPELGAAAPACPKSEERRKAAAAIFLSKASLQTRIRQASACARSFYSSASLRTKCKA